MPINIYCIRKMSLSTLINNIKTKITSEIILMFTILLLFSIPINSESYYYFSSTLTESGKILLFNDNGIYSYTQDFEIENFVLNFTEKLDNFNTYLRYISFTQILYNKKNYVFCRFKSSIYIISDETNSKNNILNETLIEDLNDVITTLFVYNDYFFIGYIKYEKLYINKYAFNENNYSIEQLNTVYDGENYGRFLSCEIMYSNELNSSIITCFTQKALKQPILVVTSFEIDTMNKIISLSDCEIETSSLLSIKSVVNKKRTKAFICYIITGELTFCIVYDINTNSFSSEIKFFEKCSGEPDTLIIKYYSEKEEIVFSCQHNNINNEIMILNDNFDIKSDNSDYEYCYNDINITDCLSSYSYGVLYLNQKNSYYIYANCFWLDGKIKLLTESIGKCNKKCSNLNFFNTTKNSTIESEDSSEDSTDDSSNDSSNDTLNDTLIHNPNEENGIIKGEIYLNKESIVENLNKLINEIEIGKIYIINGEDYGIKISPVNNKTSEGSNVNFSLCEKILRNEYNISEDSILTILQIEIDKENEQILNNQIEYAIYDENKNKLDLSKCKNVKVTINYEIKNSSLDTSTIEHFSDIGINVFDINEEFFNDICYPYSNNKTDVILSDRINDIYQNYSLCDNGCTFENINLINMQISCECDVKTEISTEIEKPQFSTMVINTLESSNINVLKCYKLVFNIKNKGTNIGFWIFLIIFLLQFPLYIYYIFYQLKPVKEFIISEMRKNDYLCGPPKHKKIKNIKDESIKKLSKSHDMENSKKSAKCLVLNNSSVANNLNVKNYSKYELTKTIEKKNKKNLMIKNNIQKEEKNHKKIEKINTNFPGYYNLIKINANNKKVKIDNVNILNIYTFHETKTQERRDFWKIFWVILLNIEIFLHTFIFKSPIELKSLRIIFFIFTIASLLSFNTLFYTNSKISNRYHYTGDNLYLYSLVNSLVISLLSSLVSILLIIMNKLTHSKYQIEDIFKEEENKMRKNKKYKISIKSKKTINIKINKVLEKWKIKNIIFLIINFILILFFFYFVTAFCAVYKDTQVSWISDCVVSIIIYMLIELLVAFANASIYVSSVSHRIECLFNVAVFIYKFK